MSIKRHLSQGADLEQYIIALENVEKQPEIAAVMAEFGHDKTLLKEGKMLHTKTQEAYQFNQTEEDETSSTYQHFKEVKSQLSETAKIITDLENARANYLKEKGESQDATKRKEAAFAALDDWMIGFYAVAKIALEDHPQLLESL